MSKRQKQIRKQRRDQKRRNNTSETQPKPTFTLEALEPRILLSASWVDTDTGDPLGDATSGNDTYTGSAGNDVADALGGDDTLSGGAGNDALLGGEGNDQLFGDVGHDTLDGGLGDDQLDGGKGNDVLISGGGNDVMDGGAGNDTFRFTGAQDGDSITVTGGSGGQDTIDLTGFSNSQLTDDGSTITADLGGGQSFSINYSDVNNIVTDDGTFSPGDIGIGAGNAAPDAIDDAVATNEGSAVTTGNVLANDTDPEVDTLSITGNTQGANGTVVNNGDGTFTYTPNANFNGSDSFNYTVDDGNGNTDTATVNVNVNAAVGGGGGAPAPSPAPSAPPAAESSPSAEDSGSDSPMDEPTEKLAEVVEETAFSDMVEETAAPELPLNIADPEVHIAPEVPAAQTPITAPEHVSPQVTTDVTVASPDESSMSTSTDDTASTVWDGTEQLDVLDVMDDVSDEIETALAEAAAVEMPAPEFSSFEPASQEPTAWDEYDMETVEELVELPPPFEIEGQSVAFAAAGFDAQTFEELFEAAPRPTAAVGESTNVAFNPPVETAEVRESESTEASTHTDEAVAINGQDTAGLVTQVEGEEPTGPPIKSSMLAYLWATVRGIGGRRLGTRRDD